MTHEEQAAHLVEYEAAQDCYLHYDSFRWQSASFLVAGVAAFWAIIASSNYESTDIAIIHGANVLVAILMSTWLLYAHHYRQIYLCKLHRIRQLELVMSMEQHRRFSPISAQRYRTFGPKGHHIDYFVYAITCIGGPMLVVFRRGCDAILALIVVSLLVVGILSWVFSNEKKINAMLQSYSP